MSAKFARPFRIGICVLALGLSSPAFARQESQCQAGELFYSADAYLGLATQEERDRFAANALVQMWGEVTPDIANLANLQAVTDYSGALAPSTAAVERALALSAAERSTALAGRSFTVGRLNRVLDSLESGSGLTARLGPALGAAGQGIDGVNILYHSANAIRTGDRTSKALAIQSAMSLARARLASSWGGSLGPMMGMVGLLEYSINAFGTDAWSRYEDYWWQAYVGYAREHHNLTALQWAELYQNEGRAGVERRLDAFWNDPDYTVDALGGMYNRGASERLSIARSAYAEAEYQRVFAARYMIEVVEPRLMQGFSQQADRLLDEAMSRFEAACEDALAEAQAIDAALALIRAAGEASEYDVDRVLDAVFENDLETIRSALASGFDPNQTLEGDTPMPFMYGAGIYLSRDPSLASAIAALVAGGGDLQPARPSGNFEPIVVPIGEGNEAGALALLDAGYRSRFSASEGDTIIRRAVIADMPGLVRRLVADGHVVNVIGPDGVPLLMTAVNRGQEESVAALLEGGADPNARGNAEGAPLHLAANRGQAGIAWRLVEAGARIDEIMSPGNRPFTPLMIAAMQGRDQTVRVLVEAGADRSVRASQGTAADYARANGHIDIADYLDALAGPARVRLSLDMVATDYSVSEDRSATLVISEGAEALTSVEIVSSAPSILAITQQPDLGDLRPMLRDVEGQGASFGFDARSVGSVTLTVTARTRSGTSVSARKSVQVTVSPREAGREVADAAREYDGARVRAILQAQDTSMQRAILQSCARGIWPACEQTIAGFAAMHFAYAGDVQTLAALAGTGVSLDYVSNDGALTPLLAAVTRGHAEAVDFLLQQGVDPDEITPLGYSAIAVAAARNDTGRVQRLLAAGADPNRGALHDGATALHHAAIHNNTAMIDLLTRHGAEALPDGGGHAPGYYAFWLHQNEALAVRLGYGEAREYAERERRRNEPGFDWAEFARRMEPALQQTMVELQAAQNQYYADVAAANSRYEAGMQGARQPTSSAPAYATSPNAGLPSPYASQWATPAPSAASPVAPERPAAGSGSAELPQCQTYGELAVFGQRPGGSQVHLKTLYVTRDTLACRRGSTRFRPSSEGSDFVTACGVRYLAIHPSLNRFTQNLIDVIEDGGSSYRIDARDIEGGVDCTVDASSVPFMSILRSIADRGPL